MVWNSTDIKIVLKVIKDARSTPICINDHVNLPYSSPICYAIQSKNMEFIEALAKTSFNGKSETDTTYFYKAVLKYHDLSHKCFEEPIEWLIFFGKNRQIIESFFPFDEENLTTLKSQKGVGYRALHFACNDGNVKAVEYLLEHSNGMDFNARAMFTRYTPLHLACQNGHIGIIKLLLEKSNEKKVDIFASARQLIHAGEHEHRYISIISPLELVQELAHNQEVKKVYEDYLQSLGWFRRFGLWRRYLANSVRHRCAGLLIVQIFCPIY